MTEQESRDRLVAQQMLLAHECLDDAEAAASRGSNRLAWNRAYYACFHAATAVFVARDRRFRKHRGIIKAVHEELVPQGVVGPEQAVAFEGLYAQRLDADYGDFLDIPREQVANTRETARRFVAALQTAIDMPGRGHRP
ncbi:MAG: HEPN domain-containing protein [Planctomycetaceae bacterium]